MPSCRAFTHAFLIVVGLCAHASLAIAQTAAPTEQPSTSEAGPLLGVFKKNTQWYFEQVSADHLRLTGSVEIEGDAVKFFADVVDLYTNTNQLVASGNVVFSNAEGRISADRVEYNTQTGTGTFYSASGILSLGPTADRLPFGGQDPDVYFYGEKVDKLSTRRYRITHGGFTTCVQPTPRWEIATSSTILELDDYAFAKNSVLRVKGVPLFYLPVLYYPIQEDDRATGFLLPTYSTSTVKGQAVSNAFFWAINRSQDATFFHDWFTRSGQGIGSEYRYVEGPQSTGTFRVYRFSRRETAALQGKKSFEVTGNATHRLGRATRASLRLDYFTDVTTQQLYHQNLYESTRSSRTINGGLSTVWGPVAASAQYQRNETFSSTTSSQVYGGTPRITGSLAPKRLFGTPVYGSVTSEYAYLPYRTLNDNVVTLDKSLQRADLAPTVRVPLSSLTYLSVNSSVTYRTTFYSRSYDADEQIVAEDYLRQYVNLRTELVGPVFTRIWDLPESGFAERLKHVVEPTFAIDYTTHIDDAARTPILSDSSDYVVGGATRFTYGLNNRLFYRARTVENVRGRTREFVTLGLQQTYYTDRQSSLYDTAYSSSTSSRKPVDLSPVALTARVSPTGDLDVTSRVEYDVSGEGLQVLTFGSNVNVGPTGGSLNYSRRRTTKSSGLDEYLSATTRFRLLEGRLTTSYNLSWNISAGYVVSQRVMTSYMSQCCGLQVDFQNYHYAPGSSYTTDRRFNVGFVLAGLGTFSNFFGAFGLQ